MVKSVPMYLKINRKGASQIFTNINTTNHVFDFGLLFNSLKVVNIMYHHIFLETHFLHSHTHNNVYSYLADGGFGLTTNLGLGIEKLHIVNLDPSHK